MRVTSERLREPKGLGSGGSAGPGDAPGDRAYVTRLEAARPADSPRVGNGRVGRTRTCFSVFPRYCSRLFDLDALHQGVGACSSLPEVIRLLNS